MINRKSLVFSLIFILLSNCSFDNKTGIWSGDEKEKRRISELEKEQQQIINIERVYSKGELIKRTSEYDNFGLLVSIYEEKLFG